MRTAQPIVSVSNQLLQAARFGQNGKACIINLTRVKRCCWLCNTTFLRFDFLPRYVLRDAFHWRKLQKQKMSSKYCNRWCFVLLIVFLTQISNYPITCHVCVPTVSIRERTSSRAAFAVSSSGISGGEFHLPASSSGPGGLWSSLQPDLGSWRCRSVSVGPVDVDGHCWQRRYTHLPVYCDRWLQRSDRSLSKGTNAFGFLIL